jgi:hypothetical protein
MTCGSACGWCGACSSEATCTDCGVPYGREYDSPNGLCAECDDRREAWATAQQLKRMAKAVLKVDLTKVKEVA